MKKLLLTSVLFLNILGVFGQKTKIYKTKVSYKSAPVKGYREYVNIKSLKLCPLQSSIYQTHIRISFDLQTIDLYSGDGVTFEGTLTNYIRMCTSSSKNNKVSHKQIYYYEKIPLSSKKAELVVQMFYKTQQFTIPTDNLIPNWTLGAIHGEKLFFEYYINKKYHKQHYSCIESQNDTILYKKVIQENQLFIEKELELDSLYANFKNKLPKDKAFYGKRDYSYFITQ